MSALLGKMKHLVLPRYMIREDRKKADDFDTRVMYTTFIKIAWPALLESFLIGVIAFVDSLMVSGCGEEAIAAVGGGFLVDAMGGTGAYLSPILYFVAVLAVSGMAEKMMARILSWILLMMPALLLRAGTTYLNVRLAYGSVSLRELLLHTLLPEALVTLLLGIPLYFIVFLCERLCRGPHHSAR